MFLLNLKCHLGKVISIRFIFAAKAGRGMVDISTNDHKNCSLAVSPVIVSNVRPKMA